MTGNPPGGSGDDPYNITGKYLLKYRKPVPCPNLQKWGRYMQMHHRKKRVRSTYIGDYWISTVFLWLDHGRGDDGNPLLFETMIFAKDVDKDELHTYCVRTTTWRKALKQHWAIVKKVKNER